MYRHLKVPKHYTSITMSSDIKTVKIATPVPAATSAKAKAPAKAKIKVNMNPEGSKYKKMSQIEHVLQCPGMYMGDIHKGEHQAYIVNEAGKFDPVVANFSPGLLKIFDEIVVNSRDASVDDETVTMIKVTIDPNEPIITVINDGAGIPIEKNAEGIWYPELIFGHLLSGSNFDNNKERLTGGLHGLGSKLTNIYSTMFEVKTGNYTQVFRENMSIVEPPVIKGKKLKGVQIRFTPDLSKFKTTLEEYKTLIVKLFEARVYDLVPTTEERVKISLNGKQLKTKTLAHYVSLYGDSKPMIDLESEHWKVAVIPADKFSAIGFVNGIQCSDGPHLTHVTNQIVDGLSDIKKFSGKNVKNLIKNHLQIFAISDIVNPSFSSQTKEKLTTPISKFKYKFKISEDLLKKLSKSEIVDRVLASFEKTEEKALAKTDGVGRKNTVRVPKLRDAQMAGTKESYKCTLFLAEGDSAASLLVAGISALPDGFKYKAVFGLRGKILNTQNSSMSGIANNAEISNLKKILGLVSGEVYTPETVKTKLRMASVCVVADADPDGRHISGLAMNIFNSLWPSLLDIPGFFSTFMTPAVIVTPNKGIKTPIEFYSQPEYELWAKGKDIKTFKAKHLKGLGTSTKEQGKKYFKELHKNQVFLEDDRDDVKMFFDGKLADQRKSWLATNERPLDSNSTNMKYKDFVNRDLFDFSIEANQRAIPDLRDGLKPSQRKILYTLFTKYKSNTKDEVKIMQLGSSVAEWTIFSHGETSLVEAIFKMCQDFQGANNINLLTGVGQYGSLNSSGGPGQDKASARYVFTKLSEVSRLIFKPVDDNILITKVEEGVEVEPEAYIGVIPMALCNGPIGIGLGYSTTMVNHNPLDLINNFKRKLQGQTYQGMLPYYNGFQGKIVAKGDKFEISGNYQYKHPNLHITELPVGLAFVDYQDHLDSLVDKGIIKQFVNKSTTEHANFLITCLKEMSKSELEKVFKLSTTISTTNMVLFIGERIKKYESVNEIMDKFYEIRMERYTKRREFIISSLTNTIKNLDVDRQLVQLVVDDKVIVFRRKKDNIKEQLTHFTLEKYAERLLGFPMSKFTEEEIEKLSNKITELNAQLDDINGKTNKDLWLGDLNELEKFLKR